MTPPRARRGRQGPTDGRIRHYPLVQRPRTGMRIRSSTRKAQHAEAANPQRVRQRAHRRRPVQQAAFRLWRGSTNARPVRRNDAHALLPGGHINQRPLLAFPGPTMKKEDRLAVSGAIFPESEHSTTWQGERLKHHRVNRQSGAKAMARRARNLSRGNLIPCLRKGLNSSCIPRGGP